MYSPHDPESTHLEKCVHMYPSTDPQECPLQLLSIIAPHWKPAKDLQTEGRIHKLWNTHTRKHKIVKVNELQPHKTTRLNFKSIVE